MVFTRMQCLLGYQPPSPDLIDSELEIPPESYVAPSINYSRKKKWFKPKKEATAERKSKNAAKKAKRKAKNAAKKQKTEIDKLRNLRFPEKLLALVNSEDVESINWVRNGQAIGLDPSQMKYDLLSNALGFATQNFSSFTRQLHHYGFRKVNCETDYHEYEHPAFKQKKTDFTKLKRSKNKKKKTKNKAAARNSVNETLPSPKFQMVQIKQEPDPDLDARQINPQEPVNLITNIKKEKEEPEEFLPIKQEVKSEVSTSTASSFGQTTSTALKVNPKQEFSPKDRCPSPSAAPTPTGNQRHFTSTVSSFGQTTSTALKVNPKQEFSFKSRCPSPSAEPKSTGNERRFTPTISSLGQKTSTALKVNPKQEFSPRGLYLTAKDDPEFYESLFKIHPNATNTRVPKRTANQFPTSRPNLDRAYFRSIYDHADYYGKGHEPTTSYYMDKQFAEDSPADHYSF